MRFWIPAGAGMTLLLCAAAHAERESYAGLPAGAEVQILQNPGFVVGYSHVRRQPLWVAYRAESLKGGRRYKRLDHFESDPRVPDPVGHRDYKGSGYTRGHLAPAYLIGRLYGRAAQNATHLMSNISPQRPELNQLVWQRLESAEADSVAPDAVLLWVVTGPLFAPQPATIRRKIPVPEAFYRIWLDLRDGAPRALGFIVPQDVCGTEPLSRYFASVDEIEQRSGLDFFHELDDAVESGLERARATDGWRVERWEKRPPRYATSFGELNCPTG